MKKLIILLSITALVSCKKEEKKKPTTTHTIQVTGNSFNSVFDCNGQMFYGGVIPTLNISAVIFNL